MTIRLALPESELLTVFMHRQCAGGQPCSLTPLVFGSGLDLPRVLMHESVVPMAWSIALDHTMNTFHMPEAFSVQCLVRHEQLT